MRPWEYLKRKFCKHTNQVFLQNVYGDLINHLGCRSIWRCIECNSTIYSDTLCYMKHNNPNVEGKITRFLSEGKFHEARLTLIDNE